MSWNDRLREAAYTSPSGVRIVFDFEDVSKVIEKKTSAFDFPDADGTYIQDLGRSGRRYPFRLFFWGDDYDLAANAFEEILLERGQGRLEHPIYGVIDVVPFGTIGRRDDLKSGANQAIFEITFWETIGVIYPTSQVDPSSSVLSAVTEYNAAIAAAFETAINLETAVDRSTFENLYTRLLNNTATSLQAIADTQDDVSERLNVVVDSINLGIDLLIAEPLTLGFQTTQLIQLPAAAVTSISARLEAYGDLITSITSGEGAVVAPSINNNNSRNQFSTNDLYASTFVTGSILSVLNNEFTIKNAALEAAELILAQLQTVTDWRDENFSSLEVIDTGEAYQQLQEAAAIAAGFLVEISFTLQQERTLILDRNRTIVDLAAELYGEVDTRLDFLISSNHLSGSEILELPKGREIVYYL